MQKLLSTGICMILIVYTPLSFAAENMEEPVTIDDLYDSALKNNKHNIAVLEFAKTNEEMREVMCSSGIAGISAIISAQEKTYAISKLAYEMSAAFNFLKLCEQETVNKCNAKKRKMQKAIHINRRILSRLKSYERILCKK